MANFIDDLLEKFYKLPKFYNLKKKEDLIGHLTACMAPHNCAGVIGRIIGFAKPQGLMASPYMHAAMRRDCDGDEAAAMLLLDVLLNFSRKFLPAHRGGTQDAPLVLNSRIRAGEVDDQILDFELVWDYPLELYEFAELGKHSSEMKIETVKKRLKEGKDNFVNTGFTHGTTDFNMGVVNSAYKSLPSMKDKVGKQMELCSKLRAVNASDVARLVIDRHFIRDIRGNLRKFAQQEFRCVTCNEKFRRPPMIGVCTKCGGKILFTISEGSIVKYLEPALDLANNFDVPAYTKQGLELAKIYIQSIFGKEETKQIELKKWF
jgi:DNA polymerase II large subunit